MWRIAFNFSNFYHCDGDSEPDGDLDGEHNSRIEKPVRQFILLSGVPMHYPLQLLIDHQVKVKIKVKAKVIVLGSK